MRRTTFTVTLAFALTAAGQVPAGPTSYAFVNVNVLALDNDRVLAGQTVVVRGDRIVGVGPGNRVRPPANAVALDATGKFLMAGITEMHGHIPPPNAPRELIDNVLFLYVANGVTTVRGMLGAPGQLDLRTRAARGEIVAPTLYLAGPSFNAQSVKSVDDATNKVRQQKAEGWDLLKVHPGPTKEQYDAMARMAREVGIRWAGHVPAEVGIVHALKSGQETIDHLDGYMEALAGDKGSVDDARFREMARLTKSAGAAVVPTMALWDTLTGVTPLETLTAYAELKYMPEAMVAGWTNTHRQRLGSPSLNKPAMQNISANRRRLLKVMQDEGVTILFGTDAPQQFSVPGYSIHREMQVMAASGLTRSQILKSATAGPGAYFKAKDRFGVIAAGARADLILLEANPLEDLANLQKRAGVMLRGRWIAEQEIQEGLKTIAR